MSIAYLALEFNDRPFCVLKTLEREVDGRKQVLEEIEKLGGKLLADAAVRNEEKIHIQEEMEILQDRWTKLHVKIHDNNKWYGTQNM